MPVHLPLFCTQPRPLAFGRHYQTVTNICKGHPVPRISSASFPRPVFRAMSTSVSTSEAATQLQSPSPPVYIDVRTPSEFANGHPPSAINCPVMNPIGVPVLSFVSNVKSHVDVDKPVLVGCKSGKRSAMAIGLLRAAGFTRLINVDGGFNDWLANQLPVEK